MKGSDEMLDYYIIYLRKSRQDDPNETIEEVLQRHETQLQELAIKLTGHKISECDIYREVVSGETIQDRPEMLKVLERIKDSNCKGVIVIEPQRLSRGDLSDLGTVINSFRYSNTLIVTPLKSFNLDDKYDREFFERELLRGKDYVEYSKEILKRGKVASVKAGNYVSSHAPYGYDRIKVGKYWTLTPNEKEAPYVKLAFDLFVNQGLGVYQVMKKLDELGAKPRYVEHFTETSTRLILTNEVYIGKIRWNETPQVKVLEDGKVVKKRVRNKNYDLYDGKHPALIDSDLFYKAQKRIGTYTRENSSYELKNMFASLLRCKKCGKIMMYQSYKNERGRKDRYCCRDRYCDNASINVALVEKAVLNTLKAYLEDFKVLISNGNEKEVQIHQQVISSLENDLIKLETKQLKLYELLEEGVYSKDVFLLRNKELASERDELKNKLKSARQSMPDTKQNEHIYYSLSEAIAALEDDNISAKVKNRFLKDIVEVIYYERNDNHKNRNPEFELEVILK